MCANGRSILYICRYGDYYYIFFYAYISIGIQMYPANTSTSTSVAKFSRYNCTAIVLERSCTTVPHIPRVTPRAIVQLCYHGTPLFFTLAYILYLKLSFKKNYNLGT